MTEQKLESYRDASGERNTESRVAELEVRNTSWRMMSSICFVIHAAGGCSGKRARYPELHFNFCCVNWRTDDSYCLTGLLYDECSEHLGMVMVNEV